MSEPAAPVHAEGAGTASPRQASTCARSRSKSSEPRYASSAAPGRGLASSTVTLSPATSASTLPRPLSSKWIGKAGCGVGQPVTRDGGQVGWRHGAGEAEPLPRPRRRPLLAEARAPGCRAGAPRPVARAPAAASTSRDRAAVAARPGVHDRRRHRRHACTASRLGPWARDRGSRDGRCPASQRCREGERILHRTAPRPAGCPRSADPRQARPAARWRARSRSPRSAESAPAPAAPRRPAAGAAENPAPVDRQAQPALRRIPGVQVAERVEHDRREPGGARRLRERPAGQRADQDRLRPRHAAGRSRTPRRPRYSGAARRRASRPAARARS